MLVINSNPMKQADSHSSIPGIPLNFLICRFEAISDSSKHADVSNEADPKLQDKPLLVVRFRCLKSRTFGIRGQVLSNDNLLLG